ncbi:glycosyl hydrolase family 16 [Chitinophaga dinghuensis]|uniref:Glycosyl hydrolase family 16 n=1 Tax=Chitinophaga dinghuensis TaxID=1539050 RepID=A0A327VWM2_9BACT|nr:family 16 glycosylhydrolase [Chitinophaga dinghuensis]RAJ80339.1 glycosyl hydrolase family 16 [Chitinophaga dinghuensis]
MKKRLFPAFCADHNLLRMIRHTGLLLLSFMMIHQVVLAQSSANPSRLQLKGTRSWIKASWKKQAAANYGVYWSTSHHQPSSPGIILPANTDKYYIQNVQPGTKYYVWVEMCFPEMKGKTIQGNVITETKWSIDSQEVRQLDIPSSAAVPAGMKLFWHDEFNDELLDKNKWHTVYYSNIDFLNKVNMDAMLGDSLPQAAYHLSGHSIDIFTNDSLPVKAYYPASGRKISSLQTYDWRTNENLLDNSRGGYFEVRVKRSFTGKPQGLNTAFWFDSPGPDLKYYLQEGTTRQGTTGVRPKGQVFEIDVFENLDAQFVLHGNVDSLGNFVHNLATHIATGVEHNNEWVTHGILWTPTSISHYINGKLIKAYTNKHQIYSPNHFMNMFLGSYGGGGSVHMEVDYIRGYQWELEGGNELPNPGFEANEQLLPWEGTGTLTQMGVRSGKHALLLKPGQEIEQYVYLNNNTDYTLSYWQKGNGEVHTTIADMKLVTGELIQTATAHTSAGNNFRQQILSFHAGKEYGQNMKTVRLHFINNGKNDIVLDDITIRKSRK